MRMNNKFSYVSNQNNLETVKIKNPILNRFLLTFIILLIFFSIADVNNASTLISVNTAKASASVILPSKFKSKSITSVKNQGDYSTCWAFSAIGMAEAELIKNNDYTRKTDFSELAVSYFTYRNVVDPLKGTKGDSNYYYNWSGFGGIYDETAAALATWKGPIKESLVPYSKISKVKKNGLADKYAYSMDAAHLQNYFFVDDDNISGIKKAIMKYGSVGVSYYTPGSEDFFNYITSAQYCYKNYRLNHLVTVVGWDDSYSRDNFCVKPKAKGAWIVKNSWGSVWGDNGYFYMSYYDKSIYSNCAVFDFDSADNYDNNYQYDGTNTTMGVGSGYNTVKAANIFKAKAATMSAVSNETATVTNTETLRAVSLYSYNTNKCDYSISVYRNLTDKSTPESGELCATCAGITGYRGYYTIPLPESVQITEGTHFSVVITLHKSGKKVKIGSECPSYYTDCYSKKNQSFFYLYDSSDLTSGKWIDYGKKYLYNLRIKAFTDN